MKLSEEDPNYESNRNLIIFYIIFIIMIKQFIREENSSKWMRYRDDPEAFNFSIADMDIGFLEEFHRKMMEKLKDKNNFTYKSQD